VDKIATTREEGQLHKDLAAKILAREKKQEIFYKNQIDKKRKQVKELQRAALQHIRTQEGLTDYVESQKMALKTKDVELKKKDEELKKKEEAMERLREELREARDQCKALEARLAEKNAKKVSGKESVFDQLDDQRLFLHSDIFEI
jgi:hypothetical protein